MDVHWSSLQPPRKLNHHRSSRGRMGAAAAGTAGRSYSIALGRRPLARSSWLSRPRIDSPAKLGQRPHYSTPESEQGKRTQQYKTSKPCRWPRSRLQFYVFKIYLINTVLPQFQFIYLYTFCKTRHSHMP
jgi:hypothetical protein